MRQLLLKEVHGLSAYLLSLPEDKCYFSFDEMMEISKHISRMMDVIYARRVS